VLENCIFGSLRKKSIFDSRNVANISDSKLRRKVQPAQTNDSTTNIVVDKWCLIQTHLSAVGNNNDIGLYANSAKALSDDRKCTLSANSYKTSIYIRFQRECQLNACFHGNFLCGLERAKRFVNIHLNRQQIEKDKQKNCRRCLPSGKISADAHTSPFCFWRYPNLHLW